MTSESRPDSDSGSAAKADDDTLETIENDVGSVFDSLAELPVVEKNEFVFDVRYFEEEFDHEELLTDVEEAKKKLEEVNNDGSSDSTVSALANVIETARLLVRQRVIVHQVVAAGLAYERRLAQTEYQRATTAIRHAREFLEDLSKNRERVEDRSSTDKTSETSVDGYDPASIRGAQDVLADIVQWTNPAYEGLQYAVRGLKSFDEGNAALDEQDYGTAKRAYETARLRFVAARDKFDSAHGKGRELPHVSPLVNGVRCLTPAYLESTRRLRDSMKEFEAGNEGRAKEIARDAISSADEKARRCL